MPPSRGRDGFEIQNNGKFLLLATGPTDRSESHEGHWDREGSSSIQVKFPNPANNRHFEILEVTSQLLRIRPLTNRNR